ncbi:MAG: hypothetical protein ACLP0J_14290 [Solirubrobacteraceae bacterium]
MLPNELLPTACFGTIGQSAQIALEAFVAGRRPPAQGAPQNPPDHDSAKWLA